MGLQILSYIDPIVAQRFVILSGLRWRRWNAQSQAIATKKTHHHFIIKWQLYYEQIIIAS